MPCQKAAVHGDVFSLIVKYCDDEISFITVGYNRTGEVSAFPRRDIPYPSPAAQRAGYTLVNTGRMRHAVFILDKPDFIKSNDADIIIHGVRNILSVQLTKGICEEAIELARSERPSPEECQPLIHLNRPLQLVSTAGVDAHLSRDMETSLRNSLEYMSELCPLIKVLGFNAVEGYVKWNFIEYEKGVSISATTINSWNMQQTMALSGFRF